MIKFFKNFQTKKHLKEENEKLKIRIDMLLYHPKLIGSGRYKLKTLHACVGVFDSEEIESQKLLLAYRLAGEIMPYIDFNSKEVNGALYDNILTGTVQIAIKSEV